MSRHWLQTVRSERAALRNAPTDPPRTSTSIDPHTTDTRTNGAPNVVLEPYRLASIETTSAPLRGVGDDWLVYRIARGANVVTGYRRGTRASVTVDVEKIVEALNERLFVRPRRVNITLGNGPTQTPRKTRDEDLV